MADFIPDNIIDEIHERIDIVEIISSYIPLRKAGRNFKAACPFHAEKTPSFMVSPDKQIFHCFGCGAGGNVFNFVMRHERLDFPEAVRMLAAKAGVRIPSSTNKPSSSSETDFILKANLLASNYYHQILKNKPQDQSARMYLKKRSIDSALIDEFKLGYALNSPDAFLSYAKSRGIKPETLEKAGLVLRRSDGRYYDRFRNRIIFPIFDVRSRVIAFGGRILETGSLKEKDLAKYINSPETRVYTKGRNLYGLNLTKEHIREKNYALIVEGYTDFLIPYQTGAKNIVASLGTALTKEQIRLLKRYTSNVVVVYDADTAGQAAALRGLDLLVEENLNVKLVNLSKGFDPDNFIREKGKEAFFKKIKEAKDLFDYKLELLTSYHKLDTLEGQVKIAGEMLPTIKRVPNAIRRSHYIKRLAEKFTTGERSLGEELLMSELKKIKLDYSGGISEERFRARPEIRSAEKILMGLMLEDGCVIDEAKKRIVPSDFQHPTLRRIAEALFKTDSQNKAVNASRLMSKLCDAQASQLISELVSEVEKLPNKRKNVEDCISWIKKDNQKRERFKLQSKIKLAQSSGNIQEVSKLISEYTKLLKNCTTQRRNK